MRSHIFTLFLLLSSVCVSSTSLFGQGSIPVKVLSIEDYVMTDVMQSGGIGGSVIVSLTLSSDGTPSDVVALHGPMYPCDSYPIEFIDAARAGVVRSIQNAKFEPIIVEGVATEQRVTFTVNLDVNFRKANRPSPTSEPGARVPKLVSGGILNGKATSLPKPRYPAEARAAGAGGAVSVSILIDEQGSVVRAGLVSGNALFTDAARTAACKSAFSPTMLSGNPVKVSGVLVYNFVP